MPTIGETIGALRRRRKLTQEELAEASGVSVETIRKLEQNDRVTARIATLNKLARALRVPTSVLFGDSGQATLSGERSSPLPLIALRTALFPARGLSGLLDPPDGPPPMLGDVEADLRAVDTAYHADDWSTAVAALPDLLARARLLAEHADSPDAQRLLAQAHQLAATVLIQL